MKKSNEISTLATLRQKAEDALKNKPLKSHLKIFEVETLEFLHELEVHQIELQMQNEELIQTKALAQETAQRYTALYDFAPCGYFTISDQGKVVEVNVCGSQMLGREKTNLTGSQFGFFVSDDTKPIFNQFLERIFSSETTETCEITLAGEKISPTYMHLTGIVIKNKMECLVTMVDITQRKHMEIELAKAKKKAEESDRLKTAFLQNMSHEIRTPIHGIMGFSEMLGKSDLSEENRKSFASIIQKSAGQLLSIVNNILTMSRLSTNQEVLDIEKVCVNKIMNDLYMLFKIQPKSQHISLSVWQALSDKESELFTDSTKLMQILTNLLGNAFKFTQAGFIEFGYTLKDSELEFYVKDSGIGNPASQQDKIFERFHQADVSNSKKFGGTGLGLSISKDLWHC